MNSTSVDVRARILAHRGLWTKRIEQNSRGAIIAALEEGFGLETDIRDWMGMLAISHDPPSSSKPLLLDELLPAIGCHPENWLALNIKSDGLVDLLPEFVNPNFFFDMSFPEKQKYLSKNRPVADRVSEFESSTSDDLATSQIVAIWIDSFVSEWFLDRDQMSQILEIPGYKFFVSPELHGRDHFAAWSALREVFLDRGDVGICTDFPREFYAWL